MADASADNARMPTTWQESRVWGVCLIVLYVVLASVPLVLAYALNAPEEDPHLLEELGKGAALMGFAMLALQAALTARIRWIDRPFGLDIVTMYGHKILGVVILCLLLAHPVLIAAGEGEWGILGLDTHWHIWLGKAALILLVLGVLMAVFFTALGIQYQTWRVAHKGMVVVIILAFAHGLYMGSGGLLQPTGMQVYWWALLALAGGIFLWRNLYVPFFGGRAFRVEAVRQESHDTWTLELQPEDGEAMPHRPGQFMFLRLKRPGRRSEEHPFTISSSPTRELPMTATIKESGDFTNTISQTREGDTARIEAPYGRFCTEFHDGPRLLFIAGGVGITPIHSILTAMHDRRDDRPMLLIYGNKTQNDILFGEELETLPENVSTVHVLSEGGEDWNGPTGYVDRSVLEEHAADFLNEAQIFLCGPPPMLDMVLDALRELEVDPDRIHYERFTL
jgi:predicted ferric reductase